LARGGKQCELKPAGPRRVPGAHGFVKLNGSLGKEAGQCQNASCNGRKPRVKKSARRAGKHVEVRPAEMNDLRDELYASGTVLHANDIGMLGEPCHPIYRYR